MNKHILLTLSILFLLHPTISQAEELSPLTLAATVAAGLKANPGVEAAHLILEQSNLEIKAARGNFFPSVSLQSSYSKTSQSSDLPLTLTAASEIGQTSLSNSVRVSQPLFAGFGILNYYAKSKLQAELDKAKLDQARLDLIAHIQQSFLQLLKNREDLNTVQGEIIRIRTQLDVSNAFYKAGLSPYNEVLKNQVDLATAQADEIKVQNSIKNFTTQLNTLIAARFDAQIDYIGDLRSLTMRVGYDENKAITTALDQRPELQVGKKSVDLAEKDVKDTISQFYPRVTLDYSKTKQDSDYVDYLVDSAKHDSDTIGVNLSWKVFNGGIHRYTYLGQLKKVASLEKSLEDLIAQTKAAIVKAFTDIDDAKKLIALSAQRKESADDNYRRAAMRYKTRIGSMTDLLDAQFDLTQAEAAVSNAYMQYHLARATLYYNLGVENNGLD